MNIAHGFNRGDDESAKIKIFNMLGECVIELADVQHLGDVGHLKNHINQINHSSDIQPTNEFVGYVFYDL